MHSNANIESAEERNQEVLPDGEKKEKEPRVASHSARTGCSAAIKAGCGRNA
jgi:hypothetical protein